MSTKEERKKKRAERKANRKPFNETGVGKFLSSAGSTITDVLGDVLPDSGVLSVVKGLIVKDEQLTPEDKEMALKMLEMDLKEMEEVTKRLQSDNEHQITRLVRPVSYGAMFILFMSIIFLDGNVGSFEVDEVYIPVINSLFGTMTIFYFGSRGVEKIMKTIYK
jgi:hypothetical protein